MNKIEFILTDADIHLLNTMQGKTVSLLQHPDAVEQNRDSMMAVWHVLAEKHGFVAESAERHPEGEPKILAEPQTTSL